MRIEKLFLTLFAATALLFGCKDPEPEPTIPTLSVGQTELSFEQNGGTATLTVTSNRAWTIASDADWLAFNPSQGSASDAPVSVTVTALSNTSNDRTSSFRVKTDFDYRNVTVSQKGQKGEDPNVTPTGKGTVDDPYNVVAANAAVKDLTWTSNEDYQSTDVVYVKGKITRLADKGSFTDGGTYGNASFYISTDGSTSENDFYVFRALYLGNNKFKSGQTDIKVGDEVVICGKLMNYKGNTPETVAGSAYLYSLNGETGGGQGTVPDPKGSGTLEDPYNPSAAADAVKNLTWTANDNYQTTGEVYVKGKISRIADNGTFTDGGTYGNASFYIVEDGTDFEFYVFRALYLGNKKFEKGQTDIKVGDEVVICGKLMNYRGNTPETEAGKAYVYSLNGETGGGSSGSEMGDPKGSGTLEDPYNPAGAADAVKDLTWTDSKTYQTTDVVYVKGKIASITESFSATGDYGNASFLISEDGTSNGTFQVFRTMYLGDKKYQSGQTDIKVGDEVIICGKLMNYHGNTPETDANNSYVYSLNGETGGGSGDVEVKDPIDITVAELFESEDSDTQPYRITGVVTNIKSTDYGNFDITDETGTIYVYGLVAKDLGGYDKNRANDKSFSSIGVQERDKITIIGYRQTYTPSSGDIVVEMVGSYYVSGASGTGETPEPEDPGELEEVKTVTVAEFLAAEDSKTQPYKLTGVVSDIANTTYGNLHLKDNTGTVYVYGLVAKDLGSFAANYANDKSFSSIGINEGDEITIIGFRQTHVPLNGDQVNEVQGAYYVSGASGSGGGEQGGETVSGNAVVFADLNIENGKQYNGSGNDKTVVKGTDFIVAFGKGGNDGKYYNTGTGIRTYGDGYIRVESSTKTITKIVFTFASGNDYRPNADNCKVSTGSFDYSTFTWTGSASSVSLTRATGSGHWRLQKVEVTFAE